MNRKQTTKPAGLSPAEPCDAKAGAHVDRVVVELNAICKGATFDFAVAVGKLIVDRFYGGDLIAWRKRGTKVASFRKLAKHPDLPMSPSALYRSVAIYELATRLGIHRTRFLSTSHLRVVLPLPDDEQRQLLVAADSQGWTVQRLTDEVERRFERAAERGVDRSAGRSRLRRALRSLERCLDRATRAVESGDIALDESSETAQCLEEILSRLRHACSALETKLVGRLPGAPGQEHAAAPGSSPNGQ